MFQYLQSPEFQQLIADDPDRYLISAFMGIVVLGMVISMIVASIPRRSYVTNHYHPQTVVEARNNPPQYLGPGYYYLDENGHAHSIPAPQQAVAQPSDDGWFDDIASEMDSLFASAMQSPATPPAHTFTSASKGNRRPKMSSSKRFRILTRDGFCCQICGSKANKAENRTLHIDHRMPQSKGGSEHDNNLWTLCNKCNIGKSDLVVPELLNGASDDEYGRGDA